MTEELFPAPPKIFSVSELTRAVRILLEKGLGEVWIGGEVANLRKQSSGHQYFTLKDDRSQVSCVLFAREASRQPALSDGMQVQIRGDLTVYEARGQYQVIVKLVQASGVGLLAAKFEALKRKLAAEGLFSAERKRELPRFPKAIGIVTSPTGAAVRDMLNILHRRAPWVRIVINPVRVQGIGASREIAEAVNQFNAFEANGLPEVEVIVVCRGGGSAEDLWEFNEEVVARAIFGSRIPVISAVGHEIDFTISDFVADLRAPTPSAAAELVAPDSAELARRFEQCGQQLRRRLQETVDQCRARLSFIERGVLFREPSKQVREWRQTVDLAEEALSRGIRDAVTEGRRVLGEAAARLKQHRPDQVATMKRRELELASGRLQERVLRRIDLEVQRLEKGRAMLRLLAPQSALDRGFSITLNGAGEIIRSVTTVQAGAEIRTVLCDGELRSLVRE